MASTASPTASNDDEEAEDNCDQKEVKEVFDEHEPFVWGLGCRDNRSLNFYVLDFVTQWSLVQKLDLDSLGEGRNGSSGYGVLNQKRKITKHITGAPSGIDGLTNCNKVERDKI